MSRFAKLFLIFFQFFISGILFLDVWLIFLEFLKIFFGVDSLANLGAKGRGEVLDLGSGGAAALGQLGVGGSFPAGQRRGGPSSSLPFARLSLHL